MSSNEMVKASPIEVSCGLAGFFVLEIIQQDGSVKSRHEFKNMVLDSGLNDIAQNVNNRYNAGGWLSCCKVGTGSSAPAPLQTALDSQLAAVDSTAITSLGNSNNQTTAPYYHQIGTQYDFAFGAVVGNITEVGIGTSTAAGFCNVRELIRDGGGVPIAITVLATEALRINYYLRCYYNQADTAGTVTIGGTNYNYIIRPLMAGGSIGFMPGNALPGNGTIGWTGGNIVFKPLDAHQQGTSSPFPLYGDNTLTDINANVSTVGGFELPNVPAANGFTCSSPAYVAGNFWQEATVQIQTTHGNISGGIGKILFGSAVGSFQIVFTPTKIPKTTLNAFTFTFRITWSRYP